MTVQQAQVQALSQNLNLLHLTLSSVMGIGLYLKLPDLPKSTYNACDDITVDSLIMHIPFNHSNT